MVGGRGQCGCGSHPGCALRRRLPGPLLCPSRVRVGPDEGALDHVARPIPLASAIGLRRQDRPASLEETGSLPVADATGDGAPRTSALGQSPPGRPGTPDPSPTREAAMVGCRPTAPRFPGRKRRVKPLPWLVRELSSGQRIRQDTALRRIGTHALGLQRLASRCLIGLAELLPEQLLSISL